VAARATRRDRILEYLSARGGAIESDDGRGITRQLADAAGYDDLSTLNGMLARLERDGAITRDVRGKRTYRIALVAATDAAAAERPQRRPVPTTRKRRRETSTAINSQDPVIVELNRTVADLAARLTDFERTVSAQQRRPRRWWRRRAR